MFDGAAPNQLALQLPAEAYYHLVRTLRLTLPPPLTDSPEDLLRRDHAAIARIGALVPANAAEAELAAQFVAASEQWKDCLRLAQAPETTSEWAAKCRAQALGMMRQANSALRLLLRMQDARRKLEADNGACDRLAWTEHCAIALMAEALEQPPTPPAAEPAPAAAPAQKRQSEPAAPAGEGSAKPAPLDQPASLAEAEHDASPYPERAVLVRRRGRPPQISFGRRDQDLVRALGARRLGGFPLSQACQEQVLSALGTIVVRSDLFSENDPASRPASE